MVMCISLVLIRQHNVRLLPGAQLITTGKKHAGVLANTDEVERRAVAAGVCFCLFPP